MRDAVTEKNSGVYGFIRLLAPLVTRFLMPIRYHHVERMQMEPPFVMVSNHVHALDPLLMAYPIKKNQCVFLGKKELARGPFTKWFMTMMHVILVDRHHSDLTAMRECMKALKMKKVLVVFPEGTRHHEGQMEQIENGASLIILRGKTPVLPVYIDRPMKLFRTVHAWVGEPIPVEDLWARGVNAETCGELNDRMRACFRELIRESQESGTAV